MTTIYFVRHAEADNTIIDGRTRPLTEKGMKDRLLATDYLQDKNIDVVLSSPYKRAVDTIADFAEKHNFEIVKIEDFRECDGTVMPTVNHVEQMWNDFNISFFDIECLKDLQARNINALNEVLTEYENKNIVIGTHGLALSVIINQYNNSFGFDDSMAKMKTLPWIVKMSFNKSKMDKIENIDLI